MRWWIKITKVLIDKNLLDKLSDRFFNFNKLENNHKRNRHVTCVVEFDINERDIYDILESGKATKNTIEKIKKFFKI